jgi:arsenate reductase
MAEGWLRCLYGDQYEAYSAGTAPYRVNPFAIEAMKRAGVDISGHRSKSVDEYAGMDFACVVTVCDHARETCPYFAGAKQYLHHSFEDPAAASGREEEVLTVFERVRDEIKEWTVRTFGSCGEQAREEDGCNAEDHREEK